MPIKLCTGCGKPREFDNRLKCRLCHLEQQRAGYRKVRTGRIRQMKSRLYGVSVDELARMEEQSNGQCACCNEVAKLQVDHCHTSGKVRGLICQRCNTAIGASGENIARLAAAIRYISKHSKEG